MIMEILSTASATTKASGILSLVTGGPAFVLGVAEGQYGAVTLGVAIGTIGAAYAIVGFLRDKQIAYLNRQIEGFMAEAENRHKLWKKAEDISDTREHELAQIKRELADLKKAACPHATADGSRCEPGKPAGHWLEEHGTP